jgi:hypothetical protein
MTGGPMSEAVVQGCVRATKNAMSRLQATAMICVLKRKDRTGPSYNSDNAVGGDLQRAHGFPG